MGKTRISTVVCISILLFVATVPVYAVVISEFMAANFTTVADEDGSTPDWIEIYNDEDATVSLEGYGLTDDPDEIHKWRFPAVSLEPGTFLLVFASGKDRADPASELHTNFRLLAPGGYLALRDVQGRVLSAFSPTYPEQIRDTSYGFKMELSRKELVAAGTTAAYLIPENNDLASTWTEKDFPDNAWTSGTTGIGFDAKAEPTYGDVIQTDVTALMQDVNSSIYIRIPFTMTAEEVTNPLRLRIRYDDGFIAFINGTEVARGNTRTTANYNARALRPRTPEDALSPETHFLLGLTDVLQEGENVLAIHAMNYSRADDDFFVLPTLESFQIVSVSQLDLQFFTEPSPGIPNGEGFAQMAPRPEFSVASTAFSEPFELTLTAPEGAEIRYTLINSIATIKQAAPVTHTSTLYEAPLTISANVMVRARVFQEGLLPGPVAEAHYVLLHTSLADFDSNLPIVIINTFGQQLPGTGTVGFPAPMHFYIIERDKDGRAHMTGEVHHASLGSAKARGSSTGGRPKASMSIEMQDAAAWLPNPEQPSQLEHPDKEFEILGLPLEADFVLWGAYNFDHALMRNPFIYDLSNMCGQYGARSRFCEVWLNRGNGAVSSAHYMGVYSFMERLTRNVNRVDIRPIYPTENEEPEVSGGFIVKRDRNDPGESPFSGGGYSLVWVYPDAHEVTAQQRSWLINYLNQMNAAVRSLDPRRYEEWIDVDGWIDHHILNVFPKNVDAFRLSGYMFKDRGGKLVMGPIWDYDRAMGSTDGRDRYWDRWENTGGDGGTSYFAYGWYGPLFGNQPPLGTSEWATRYRARWRELRSGPLASENVLGLIDSMAAEIGQEAAGRNWTKWRQGSNNYQVSVNNLRNWIENRLEWIDGQFIEPPDLSPRGGLVDVDSEVTISVPEGEIFYTIDGSDPKGPGNDPRPEALRYSETGPIRITENTQINARARLGATLWTKQASESYYTYLPPLVVTEVMYNPMPDPDGIYASLNLEFVEIQNISDTETTDLTGVKFVGTRLSFDFTNSAVTRLAPKEFAVVCRNLDAFTAIYGAGINVAGEYTGALSNLRMEIDLDGPVGEPLMLFTYQDQWEPSTDGQGHSLVIKDPTAPRESWNESESWQASADVWGSPGRADGVKGQVPGDFNQDGRCTISDATRELSYLFGIAGTAPCTSDEGNLAVMDMNGDGQANLADPVYLLSYLFLSGSPPALGTTCVPIAGCPEVCP